MMQINFCETSAEKFEPVPCRIDLARDPLLDFLSRMENGAQAKLFTAISDRHTKIDRSL
jgi:hypothetical protein